MCSDLTFHGQMRIAKLKSAYNSPFIGLRGLGCETNLLEIIGLESSDVVSFDIGPLHQGQTRIAKLKNAYNFHIIGPRGLGCETTYRKSWAGSLGFLLQGQTMIAKLQSAYNSLIIGCRGLGCETNL